MRVLTHSCRGRRFWAPGRTGLGEEGSDSSALSSVARCRGPMRREKKWETHTFICFEFTVVLRSRASSKCLTDLIHEGLLGLLGLYRPKAPHNTPIKLPLFPGSESWNRQEAHTSRHAHAKCTHARCTHTAPHTFHTLDTPAPKRAALCW